MIRRTILFQIGSLSLVILVAVQLISVAVVLLTPPPAPPRMSPALVRDALADEAVAHRLGLRRTTVAQPAFTTSAGTGAQIASALASVLALPDDHVRVHVASTSARNKIGAYEPVTVVATHSSTGQTEVDILAAPPPVPAGMDKGLGAAYMIPAFTLPAFETAVRRPDGRWIVVGPPDHRLSGWLIRLASILGASLLILAPLVWWAARRLTLPVRGLALAAERMRLGDGSAFLPMDGPREIVAVAEALDAMRERLTRQAEERMRMLAAVAHDLRTPLTGLRIRAETAPPGERDRMAADINRMEAMISDVLAFSSSANGQEERERLDLAALCRDSVVDAVSQGMAVTLTVGSHVMINAGPIRVRRILLNLLDNAVRYGGAAEVRLAIQGGIAVLTVSDRGPGLSPEQLEKVMEPFYRIEGSRSRSTGGVGLGLTIARELAARDAGLLALSPRSGGGLTATLRYPVIERR